MTDCMTMKITVFKTLVLSGVLAASSGGFSSNEEVLKQEEDERNQKAVSEIEAAGEIMEANKAKLEEIIQNSKYVAGWQPGSSVESLSGETQKYRTLQQQILTLQSEIAQLQVHNDRLKDLHDEALRAYVVNSDILTSESPASARVRQYDKDLQDKEDKKAQMLLEGFGENHPMVLDLDEDIARTRMLLNESLSDMREVVQNQLYIKREELDYRNRELKEVGCALREELRKAEEIQEVYEEYKRSAENYKQLELKYKEHKE